MNLDQNNWVPAVVFGGLLVVLGVAMMAAHQRSWRRQREAAGLDEFERGHLQGRYLRRMQTSAVLTATGLLIAVGDVFIWRFGPLASTLFWLAVLGLVGWLGLLGLSDLLAVRAWQQAALARNEGARRALRGELERLRKDHGQS